MLNRVLSLSLLMALVAVLISCNGAGGNGTLGRIYKDNVVYIGTVPFEPPLLFQREGELIGPDARLAHQIVETIQAGEPHGEPLRLNWITRTYSTLTPALLNEEVHFVLGAFAITEERKQQIAFSEPYYTSELVLIINPAHKDLRPNQLDGARIGVRSGTGVEEVVSEKYPAAVIQPFETIDEAILTLRRNEIDGVIDDRNLASYSLATTPGVAHLEFLPDILGTLEFAVAVRKGDTEMLKLINDIISQVNSQHLYAQWLDENLDERFREVANRRDKRLQKAHQAVQPRRVLIRVSKSAGYDFDIYRMANLSWTLRNRNTGSSYSSSRINFSGSLGTASAQVPPGDYALSLPRFNFSTGVSIGTNDPQQVTISIQLTPGGVVIRKG